MDWQIKFSEEAEAQLQRIGTADARRILKQSRRLAEIDDLKLLLSPMKYEATGFYKYRIGNFRVILQLDDDKRILFILMIEHRKSVYKHFKQKGL